MFEMFDELGTVDVEKKRIKKPRKEKVKDPVFQFIADTHNSILVDKAVSDFERSVQKSLRLYNGPYYDTSIARFAIAKLNRLWNDAICLDMLITNDPNMDEVEGQQIRAIRYFIKEHSVINHPDPIISEESDFAKWLGWAELGGDRDCFIDAKLTINKRIRELEKRHLIKCVGGSYVILHAQLLNGIWDDDEARQNKSKQFDKEFEQRELSGTDE